MKNAIEKKWIEVHEHMWMRDESGEINEIAWYSGFHNGPYCELCDAHPCVHCEPDYMNSICDEISYKCPVCGAHKVEKTNFCPDCGERLK